MRRHGAGRARLAGEGLGGRRRGRLRRTGGERHQDGEGQTRFHHAKNSAKLRDPSTPRAASLQSTGDLFAFAPDTVMTERAIKDRSPWTPSKSPDCNNISGRSSVSVI